MSARRPWAWPLVPVYAAVIAVKERLRGAGVLKTKRLAWPVVSVGSISAGGAGKTPVVIALAKMLRDRGWDVDVLSRGYGRSGKGVECVGGPGEQQNPSGNDTKKDEGAWEGLADAAARFGDEPVLMARKAEVPVWVGAERFAAGVQAERSAGDRKAETQRARRNDAEDAKNALLEGGRVGHLLDDGFQHRQLAREFDVVVVTAEDLNDALLPAGNLRERVSALRRADAVVVREREIEAVKDRVWPLLREGAQMWVVRRRLHFPAPLFVFGAGLRPVAFCAIARPEGFAAALMEAGCGVVETIAFADHHAYAMRDMAEILRVARAREASGFVTTEKDAVKLSAAMRERLETLGPVMVVALEAEFVDAEAVLRAIEAKIAGAEARA